MGDTENRSLTRREFDAVIRRAAEFATSDPDGADGALTEGELFRIAGEVGLSDAHVRRALSDVRSGVEAGGVLDRVFGPSTIRASRVVAGEPKKLSAEIDEFLVASRLLQPVRRGIGILQYRPAVDWASQLARAASFSSRKYYVASARSVEVTLEDVGEGRTLVEFLVDPGTRSDDVAGAVFGGGTVGGALGTVAGIGLAAVAPVGLAVGAGVVVGAGIWTGIAHAVGRSHKKKLREVRTEVEAVLDSLEMGVSLEPPPASWRRWVKRHFHGVARDLIDIDDDVRDR
jgi:hypothetical protein